MDYVNKIANKCRFKINDIRKEIDYIDDNNIDTNENEYKMEILQLLLIKLNDIYKLLITN